MPRNYISEDNIEQAILQKLRRECGFELLNCYTAPPDDLNDGSKKSPAISALWWSPTGRTWTARFTATL